MESQFTRGGRGKKAPYETTHVRIPTVLKLYVSELSDTYKKCLENETDKEYVQNLTNSINKPVNKNSFVVLAEEIIRLRQQKKSTKVALDNLLTAILESE